MPLRRRFLSSSSMTSQEVPPALVVEVELGVARDAEGGRRRGSPGPGRGSRSSAQITSSSRTWTMPSTPGGRTRRGSRAGHLHDREARLAPRPPGARASTARLRLRPASIGKGREASMASGVSAGSTSSRK